MTKQITKNKTQLKIENMENRVPTVKNSKNYEVSYKLENSNHRCRICIVVRIDECQLINLPLKYCLVTQNNWHEGQFKDKQTNSKRQIVLDNLKNCVISFIDRHHEENLEYPSYFDLRVFIEQKNTKFWKVPEWKRQFINEEGFLNILTMYLYECYELLPYEILSADFSDEIVCYLFELMISVGDFEVENDISVSLADLQNEEFIYELFDYILTERDYHNGEVKGVMSALDKFLSLLHKRHYIDVDPFYLFSLDAKFSFSLTPLTKRDKERISELTRDDEDGL